MLSNVCFGFFDADPNLAWCESLGSAVDENLPGVPRPFDLLHREVNTFKTPEMCFYLDSDVWAGCSTIVFTGSFHYFKPVSAWILFCENVAGVPRPFYQLLRVRKLNMFENWNAPLFRLRHLRWISHNYFCWIFSLSFLPKLTVKWDKSSRLFWPATNPCWQHCCYGIVSLVWTRPCIFM